VTTVEDHTTADVPWPESAPDVRLGGLLLLDSSVMPATAIHSDEDGPGEPDTDKPQRDWNVYLVRLASDPAGREYGLIGELFVCEGEWHLKVSALTPLQLRGSLREEAHTLGSQALTERYGPWATHVLWDFVAQHARILAAGVLRKFDLPPESPEAEYGVPAYLRAGHE
jgi:hypothetical protein